MLNATFCCFKGISEQAERRLWQAGVLSWDDLTRDGKAVLSAAKLELVKRQIDEARIAWNTGLADYFLNRLPPAHRVRIWRDFHDRLLALDIETDGLSQRADVLTVAICRSGGTRVWVKGVDLSRWMTCLLDSPVLMTFNGARFDLLLLRQRFGLALGYPHLDLMEVFKAMGYHGGQKICERRLGIRRDESAGICGKDVAALWRSWTDHGDRASIERLVAYNGEDARNLFALGWAAYRVSMSGYPLVGSRPEMRKSMRRVEWFGSLTTENAQVIVGTPAR